MSQPTPDEQRQDEIPEAWTTQKSLELYGVERWGDDLFSIGENGHMTVRPRRGDAATIDLVDLVGDLRRRGLRTPMLIRFSDILAGQVQRMAETFRAATSEYGYKGKHHTVYPIKVNQQRHVVEELVQLDEPNSISLEAGSKPELLIALALLDRKGALIVCNGFKDRAYIETALLAQRLGRLPLIVVDRFDELDLVIKASQELGIRPHVGLRVRLAAQGAGKWMESTGRRSKFGLSPGEVLAAVTRLRADDMLDCLELVHYHIGSQISAIRAHKEALREVSRIFVGLHELGAQSLRYVDIGGGMAVDYDGSQTDSNSSMNYTADEYARDAVDAIVSACDEAGLAHPDIITEAGRALAAHHSVLVFDVIGRHGMVPPTDPPPADADSHRILKDLIVVADDLTADNVKETYHDALQLRDEAITSFALGYLDLSTRGRVDEVFLHLCSRILNLASQLDESPEEFARLERDLADTYYGNFSVFQSMPDHWAVGQLFPTLPIQRLDEEPTRRAVFADLTCDSDGKIDTFIDRDAPKQVLEVHTLDERPYYMGVFLCGAYQEILGDLHNLFGDTDAVHVRLDEDGLVAVEHVVDGDSVSEVLSYVQYDLRALMEKVRRTIEGALRRGEIGLEESTLLRRRYEQGLLEYTYLSQD